MIGTLQSTKNKVQNLFSPYEQTMRIPPYTNIIQNLPAMVPFVGPETIERKRGRPFKVRIGANESVFGISPRAQEAMADTAGQVWKYCDPEGYDLRAGLAQFHGVSIDNVVLGSGIDDILGFIVRTFVNPGDVVVTSYGAYPTFTYHVNGYGGQLQMVPYRDDRNDLEALVDTATQHRARVLFLANPDNPTGSYYDREDIHDLIERLPPDCLFLYDEAYIDFVPPETILPVNCDDPRMIRVRTFSKAHGMAGGRVGYALAHRDIVDTFNKVRLHFGVNLIAQAGALASLHDQDFVQSVVRAVEEGRRDYEALACDTGIPTLPSMTNFVAFDFGTNDRATRVMNDLIDNDVFVRMPGVPPLNRCVRITVGTPEDRAVFAEIFRRVVQEAG